MVGAQSRERGRVQNRVQTQLRADSMDWLKNTKEVGPADGTWGGHQRTSFRDKAFVARKVHHGSFSRRRVCFSRVGEGGRVRFRGRVGSAIASQTRCLRARVGEEKRTVMRTGTRASSRACHASLLRRRFVLVELDHLHVCAFLRGHLVHRRQLELVLQAHRLGGFIRRSVLPNAIHDLR